MDEMEPMVPRFKNDRAILELILEHMDETNIARMEKVDRLIHEKRYESLSPEEKRLVETFEEWHELFYKNHLDKLFDRIMLMKELCGDPVSKAKGKSINDIEAPKKPAAKKTPKKTSNSPQTPEFTGFQPASKLKRWGA